MMPLHRHYSFLQEELDFSPSFSLNPSIRLRANAQFGELIKSYGVFQMGSKGYKPAALLQSTFDFVASKDAFLNFFFLYQYSSMSSTEEVEPNDDIRPALDFFDGLSLSDLQKQENIKSAAVEDFADYLVDNFLLPFRASSMKTPQPTPASLSSMQSSTPAGVRQRVSLLRQRCLIRDHHRCVVSRKFDRSEARKRFQKYGEDCQDDGGIPLKDETSDNFQYLEVAHILPHCLTAVASGDTELSEPKRTVLQILDMFDPGIIHLIDGPDIVSPLNALTLTLDYHRLFGEFQILFTPTGKPYEYRIDSTELSPFLRDPLFPITRTLTLSPNRTIDPPSSRLFGIHRAIAHILELSGAGEYIEQILNDIL
ncbi:hypothetical protein ASPZODRAFT_690298 [Penicilliopsis zonata CBS 506.65]|uniref:HNH nuclease domain-containing protein n=1 Tax=Penicilliopsis zonata CBS 506.65 TaxID=1073090 RepID=A0A1L9SBL1_9EURO|nr:hypothetical protein ASPZODRAFT_690298 [Penicilliopsis zonata CBS 506.65]OJJ44546.1 hypothetical protein ASPZODRAFT_690298 [Penicilliopsis zonata CBS 506.65]